MRYALATYPTYTMPLPALDDSGVLPLGAPFGQWEGKQVYFGHDCDVDEVKEAFVARFPGSVTRAKLFDELENSLSLAKEHLACFQLMVSGEFVTSRTDPEDIFLALAVVGEELRTVDAQVLWHLDRLFNAHEFKIGESTELLIQTYFVRAYPPGHHRHTLGWHERLLAMYYAGYPVPDVQAGYADVLWCEGGWDFASIFRTSANGD